MAVVLLASPGTSQGSASPPAAGEDRAQASIIGGTPGSIAANPSLAFVLYRGPVEQFGCGGSVVAPRLILTAAHCVLTGTGRVAVPSNFAVLTGVANLKEATRERLSRVARVLVFPGYNPVRILNDAALLVLAEPAAAPPVALATPGDAALLAAGTPVTVAGWGLTSFFPRRLPALFREGQSIVQSDSSCRRRLRREVEELVPGAQLCVKSRASSGPGLCNGDSGGPVVARRPDGTPVQIGIVSLKGAFDCDPRSPQILARADRVAPWVAAWTAAIEAGAPAPAVAIPAARLPGLTRRDAEALAWLGLEADFGRLFAGGRGHRIGCKRINREKVKCAVLWLGGRDLYTGTITLFTALPREGSIYNYRYTIRRFNFRCWLSSRNPSRSCNPRRFKR
jgi:secreted trypsin-like serine protease